MFNGPFLNHRAKKHKSFELSNTDFQNPADVDIFLSIKINIDQKKIYVLWE